MEGAYLLEARTAVLGQWGVLQGGAAAAQEVVRAPRVVKGICRVALRAERPVAGRRPRRCSSSGRRRSRRRSSSSSRGLVPVGVEGVHVKVGIFVVRLIIGEVGLGVEGMSGARSEGVGGVHGGQLVPRPAVTAVPRPVLGLERLQLYGEGRLRHRRRHQAFRVYELLVVLQPHHRQQGCLPRHSRRRVRQEGEAGSRQSETRQ